MRQISCHKNEVFFANEIRLLVRMVVAKQPRLKNIMFSLKVQLEKGKIQILEE